MLKIGIVGTGAIAAQMARACGMTEGVEAWAVSSRSREKAEAFARAHGIPCAFEGEDALCARPEVGLVYVATPHPAHFAAVMTALRAGKPVLCEKPMAMNGAEARALFEEADRRGLFLMEGMWTRFLPNMVTAKRWVDSGRIGRVRFIDGMFSFPTDPAHPNPRLVRAELGGGAMLDVGVYTVETASWFAGEHPCKSAAFCEPYAPGVDGTSAMLLRFPGGALATLRTGIDCPGGASMTVWGEKGRIELPGFFSAPEARLYEGMAREPSETVAENCDLPRGFTFQLAAVREDLAAGRTRSAVVPPEDTEDSCRLLGETMRRFFPDLSR